MGSELISDRVGRVQVSGSGTKRLTTPRYSSNLARHAQHVDADKSKTLHRAAAVGSWYLSALSSCTSGLVQCSTSPADRLASNGVLSAWQRNQLLGLHSQQR